jgi:hypothetical protein
MVVKNTLVTKEERSRTKEEGERPGRGRKRHKV